MPHLTTQQLLDFNEGRLEADARAAAHAHLQECALCSHEVAMFQEAMTTFLNGPSAELPPLPAALANAAVARARAEFPPVPGLLTQLGEALTACLSKLTSQLSQAIVPPVGRAPTVGIAQDRKVLHVMSETMQLPESNLTVHCALSEAMATLVVEGADAELRGYQVVAVTLADELESRHLLGKLDERGALSVPASDVLTLNRLEVVPPPP